jgi:hypothetical protein
MLPDPASTMDMTTTVISHAGLGPYKPLHKLGTAPFTAINKQYAIYWLFLLLISYFTNMSTQDKIYRKAC